MIGFGYLVLSGTFLMTAANSLRRKVF
jgi:hypothetical protein